MFRSIVLGLTAVIALTSAPVFAASFGTAPAFTAGGTDDGIAERRRPRVPGGSGCDSPRDLIEHPECRG